MVLAIISVLICCIFLNSAGAYGFIVNGYMQCGYALIISTVFLVASLIFSAFKKVIIPLIFNIIGSGLYIYALSVISAIPNSLVPKAATERLMLNHYPTISVTVLLSLLIFFNFMTNGTLKRFSDKKAAKKAADSRNLNDNERIL